MPRGVYTRKKKAVTKSSRRTNNRKQNTTPVTEESDFLTHGSTHAREKAQGYTSLFDEHQRLAADADVLASFILANVPYKSGIPGDVLRAYRNVKSRALVLLGTPH